MKITIELDDNDLDQNFLTWPPKPMKKINDTNQTDDFYSHKSLTSNDNGWVNGNDICATCPNRPGSPNNKSGFCMCAIPSMYGPQRVTC